MHRFSVSRCCCGDNPPPALLPPAFWGMATNYINLPSQDDPSQNEYLFEFEGATTGIPHLEPQRFGYDSTQTFFEFGWSGFEFQSPGNPGNFEQFYAADGVCMSWVGGGPTRFQYGPNFVPYPNFGGDTFQPLRWESGTQDYTVKLKFYMYNIQSPSPYGMSTLQWNVGQYWGQTSSNQLNNPEHYRGKAYDFPSYPGLNDVPSGIPQDAVANGMPNPRPYSEGPGADPDGYWVYTHKNTSGGNFDYTPFPQYFDGESTGVGASQILFENDDSKPSINANGQPANISDYCYPIELDITPLYHQWALAKPNLGTVQVFNINVTPVIPQPAFSSWFPGLTLPRFAIIGDSRAPGVDTGVGVPGPELIFEDI